MGAKALRAGNQAVEAPGVLAGLPPLPLPPPPPPATPLTPLKGGEEDGKDADASTQGTGSPSSTLSSASSSWSGGAERTLIIFDWDDTLLCSSVLDRTPRDSPRLRELETTVESLLRTAMRLGETMIVTNGCANWVQESARVYLPALLPTLESLPVLSARALYEQLHPADPPSWKRRCFRKVLKRKRLEGHDGLNLVVLGDQAAEMQAVHYAVKVLREPSLIKTVKFTEAPSLQQLLGELRKVAQELGGLVRSETSSSTDLTRRRCIQPCEEQSAEWATSWTLTSGRDWARMAELLRAGPDSDESEDEDVTEVALEQELRTAVLGERTLEEDLDLEEAWLEDPSKVNRGGGHSPVCLLCAWGSDMRADAAQTFPMQEEHLGILSI